MFATKLSTTPSLAVLTLLTLTSALADGPDRLRYPEYYAGVRTLTGPSCEDRAPGDHCFAIKFLVYKDAQGWPVVSETQLIRHLEEINDIWSQCGVAFQAENIV